MEIVHADDGSFRSLVQDRQGVVLVDFEARWCPPCRAMEPVVRALAEDGHAIVKVNADEAPGVAAEYGVRALPTFIVFRDGMPVGQLVGKQSRASVEQMLQRAVPTEARRSI